MASQQVALSTRVPELKGKAAVGKGSYVFTRAAGESLKTKNETGDPTRHARRRRLASEGDCVRALEALGFEAFYGGDADEEWVAQVRGKDA